MKLFVWHIGDLSEIEIGFAIAETIEEAKEFVMKEGCCSSSSPLFDELPCEYEVDKSMSYHAAHSG